MLFEQDLMSSTFSVWWFGWHYTCGSLGVSYEGAWESTPLSFLPALAHPWYLDSTVGWEAIEYTDRFLLKMESVHYVVASLDTCTPNTVPCT